MFNVQGLSGFVYSVGKNIFMKLQYQCTLNNLRNNAETVAF